MDTNLKVDGVNIEWDCGDGCCSETTLEITITHPNGKDETWECLGTSAWDLNHLKTLAENTDIALYDGSYLKDHKNVEYTLVDRPY